MNRLEGKKVLVTGASSGFGRAIALACAAEGADVAVLARREERLRKLATEIEEMGRRAVVCVADVSSEDQIRAGIRTALQTLGQIDVLVNNAGTNVNERSLQDTRSDQWRLIMDVNLTSAYLFSKELLPRMAEQGGGTIINVSSRAANHPSLMAGVAYSSAKAGMNALTQVTNEEGNPVNVRSCVICPGVANTELLDRRPSPPPNAVRQQMMQAEDVADAAVFVAALPPRVNVEKIDLKPTSVDVT